MADALRYREHEEIGRGGMAAVYRAENIETGREVALKLKRPMPWDGCNERLRREADSLSSNEISGASMGGSATAAAGRSALTLPGPSSEAY